MLKQQDIVTTPAIRNQLGKIGGSRDEFQQEIALGQAARLAKSELANTISVDLLNRVTQETWGKSFNDLEAAKYQDKLERPTTVKDIMSSGVDSEFGRLAKIEIYDALVRKKINEESSIEDVKSALEEIRVELSRDKYKIDSFVAKKSQANQQNPDDSITKQFGITPQTALDESLRLLKNGLSVDSFLAISKKLEGISDLNERAATSIALVCQNSLISSNEHYTLLTKALSFDAHNASVLASIGYAHEKGLGVQKNQDIAYEYYTKAISEDPNNTYGLVRLGNYHSPSADGSYDKDKMFHYFQRAVLADPTDASALNALSYCYRNGLGATKDYQEALRLITEACKQDPYSASYFSIKGRLQEELGGRSDVHLSYKRAYELSPKNEKFKADYLRTQYWVSDLNRK